jgi:hypothetical protein
MARLKKAEKAALMAPHEGVPGTVYRIVNMQRFAEICAPEIKAYYGRGATRGDLVEAIVEQMGKKSLVVAGRYLDVRSSGKLLNNRPQVLFEAIITGVEVKLPVSLLYDRTLLEPIEPKLPKVGDCFFVSDHIPQERYTITHVEPKMYIRATCRSGAYTWNIQQWIKAEDKIVPINRPFKTKVRVKEFKPRTFRFIGYVSLKSGAIPVPPGSNIVTETEHQRETRKLMRQNPWAFRNNPEMALMMAMDMHRRGNPHFHHPLMMMGRKFR